MHFTDGANSLHLTAAVLLTCAVCALSLTVCPNCGPTPVPYPLSTSPDCGDPSYEIRCNGTSLFFDSVNNTYPITSISPSTQRLTIEPSPLIPNTCITSDLRFNGPQLNSSAPFNITNRNTFFYLNCSDAVLMSPLNCSSNNLCHVYINNTASAAAIGGCTNSQICCALRSGASVTRYQVAFQGGCGAYQSFANLDSSLPVSRWPAPGIELQWLLPREPICAELGDCDSGSTCGPDPNPSGGRVNRCFCNPGLQWNPVVAMCVRGYQDSDDDGKRQTGLITGLTSGLGSTLLAVVISFLFYKRRQRIKREQERITREREEILNAGGGKSAKVFTGKEIKKATNNFSKEYLLGMGGFGEVYKGILEDGTVVAVKCAKLGNTKGTDQVLNEVRILCQLSHKSLVGLLGCCVELQEPVLIYEYVENGALMDHLRLRGDKKIIFLSWIHRLRIAYQTAEGLAYLHFSAVPRIYHRDVKSSNILLDSNLNAKVSDFGLSRLAHTDLSHISTCAQGTLGYIDPEYYRSFKLTDKSDVYSFGVVLLELLTSQRVIDFTREEDDVNLVAYAQRLAHEDRIIDMVDPMLIGEDMSDLELPSMKAVGFLALQCLNERRQDRPSMKEVAEELEYIIGTVTNYSG